MEVEYCSITYDDTDGIYIAKSAQFPGIQAHGHDPKAALREMEYVLGVENLKQRSAPGCTSRPYPYGNE